MFHGPKQLFERFGELAHAILEQHVCMLLKSDAQFGECFQRVVCLLETVLQAGLGPPMVTKSLEGRRRHSVDRVGPDQFLDVHDIGVNRVLGRRACPKEALRLGAFLRQGGPSRATADFLVALVGELGVRNRHLALQTASERPLRRRARALNPFRELCIDDGVDPADKKARDRGDARHVQPLLGARFEPCDVGLGHLFVHRDRKEERHVDTQPARNKLADRGNSRIRSRNLDHQVLTADSLPKPQRLCDSPVCVMGEGRRDL